ncbi:MarR family winged helix-turn-helix transcriptional regulator [Bradyrhizobium erythrophlei]|uniref:DNA-binding transcriptional regulator, MarR family n=1 Tax=Bradyrhizobium erythrophlei TaxID=1437360 RepID=A0A1M5VHM6_9BRAD|nr:MarR family transcriptional regulator [Bradyrhizobium erythrophlei]SHH74737.1 DNA-binding transcriptional regulator, MarR family [Bradyrhizobium erythrophlei]
MIKRKANKRTAKFRDSKADASRRVPAKADPQADPVETILTQWQRERPDLDPAPMQLFGLVARAQFLSTVYFNELLEQWNLSRGSFDVLAALRRSGPPFTLTPKQLSDSLMLSGAGMTSRLDRLESLRLIVRLPEPTDRRSLKIQLTPRGVRMIDEVVPAIVDAQWKIAATLGPEKTASLTKSMRQLTDALTKPRDR